MEIDRTQQLESLSVTPWNLSALRTVRQKIDSLSIYASKSRVWQRLYFYDSGHLADLTVRRTVGLPFSGSVHELVWTQAEAPDGQLFYIGLESAYVYERTGLLINPRIALGKHPQWVPVQDIVEAVLLQLEPILGFHTGSVVDVDELPDRIRHSKLVNYLALDHKQQCKLIVVGSHRVLDALEVQAKSYCSDYWAGHQRMGKRVALVLNLALYPTQRFWAMDDLADLAEGDLLALQARQTSSSLAPALRGQLRLCGQTNRSSTYEVFVQMNDEDASLQFCSEPQLDDDPPPSVQVPPHELIELQIYAGAIQVPFGDLCAVQAGTLVELTEHHLPMVTLCVNGSPILEGELVVFKDQVMVQIVKRLE